MKYFKNMTKGENEFDNWNVDLPAPPPADAIFSSFFLSNLINYTKFKLTNTDNLNLMFSNFFWKTKYFYKLWLQQKNNKHIK